MGAAGGGLMIAGALMSAYGQYKAGQEAAAAARVNERLAQWMAGEAERRGEGKAALKRMEGSAIIGKARAGAGASGLATESGSFVATNETTRAMSEYDAAVLKRDALLEAMGYRANAASAASQARQAEAQGTYGALGTMASAFYKVKIGKG